MILGHNQDLLITDQRLSIQRTDVDYSLTISDVTVHDEGNYACEINTQPPQRAIVHLYVEGKKKKGNSPYARVERINKGESLI